MADGQGERVLVVPTELFHRLGYFQGFCGDVARYLDELLDPRHTSFRPRDRVETDPSFKQLIPYVLFQHRAPQGPALFQYTRGKGQGEARLHAKRSVGVGGHISLQDAADKASGADSYAEGMRRELEEEVVIDTQYTQRCVGLINDDQTDVGRVHLGVVHCIEVDRPCVLPREADLHDAGFRPVAEILSDLAGFETWSQICLRALFS
jgi:predicted NUDIX family phosphoesterase